MDHTQNDFFLNYLEIALSESLMLPRANKDITVNSWIIYTLNHIYTVYYTSFVTGFLWIDNISLQCAWYVLLQFDKG